jgi:hypothetical protein
LQKWFVSYCAKIKSIPFVLFFFFSLWCEWTFRLSCEISLAKTNQSMYRYVRRQYDQKSSPRRVGTIMRKRFVRKYSETLGMVSKGLLRTLVFSKRIIRLRWKTYNKSSRSTFQKVNLCERGLFVGPYPIKKSWFSLTIWQTSAESDFKSMPRLMGSVIPDLASMRN